MASNNNSKDLTNIIHRYAETADRVNRREMTRFINEVRTKWAPEPEDEYMNPHYEGYTEAGAFTQCIYELAFGDLDPPRNRHDQLCEAEQKNQVLLCPHVAELVEWIEKPLAPPQSRGVVDGKLAELRAHLQQQVDALETEQKVEVELPPDFEALMSITDGLQGAGVPSETAYLQLVYPLSRQRAEFSFPVCIRRRHFGETALAAWEFGSCVQHRQIWYILQAPLEGGPEWKVYDNPGPGEDTYHEDFTAFLEREMENVETRPGGAQVEAIVHEGCTYPIWYPPGMR